MPCLRALPIPWLRGSSQEFQITHCEIAIALLTVAILKPVFHFRINSRESTLLRVNWIGFSLVRVDSLCDKRKIWFVRIYLQVKNRLYIWNSGKQTKLYCRKLTLRNGKYWRHLCILYHNHLLKKLPVKEIKITCYEIWLLSRNCLYITAL